MSPTLEVGGPEQLALYCLLTHDATQLVQGVVSAVTQRDFTAHPRVELRTLHLARGWSIFFGWELLFTFASFMSRR